MATNDSTITVKVMSDGRNIQDSIEKDLNDAIRNVNNITTILANPIFNGDIEGIDDMGNYYPSDVLQRFRACCEVISQGMKRAVKAREDWSVQIDEEHETIVNKYSSTIACLASTEKELEIQANLAASQQKILGQAIQDELSAERDSNTAKVELDKKEQELKDAEEAAHPRPTGSIWLDILHSFGTPDNHMALASLRIQQSNEIIAARTNYQAFAEKYQLRQSIVTDLKKQLEKVQSKVSETNQEREKLKQQAEFLQDVQKTLLNRQENLTQLKIIAEDMLELVNKPFRGAQNLGAFLSMQTMINSVKTFITAIKASSTSHTELETVDQVAFEDLEGQIRTALSTEGGVSA